jgi:hypothetical protein
VTGARPSCVAARGRGSGVAGRPKTATSARRAARPRPHTGAGPEPAVIVIAAPDSHAGPHTLRLPAGMSQRADRADRAERMERLDRPDLDRRHRPARARKRGHQPLVYGTARSPPHCPTRSRCASRPRGRQGRLRHKRAFVPGAAVRSSQRAGNRSPGRPPEQLLDTPALALGRAARAAVAGSHHDSFLAGRRGRAVVDITLSGNRGGDTLGDDPLDDHDAIASFVAQPHLITRPHGMRGLNPYPVDPDMPGPAGTGRGRAGSGQPH